MKQYFRIDHRILFLLGYIFYLFTPLIVGYFNFFEGYPGIDLYKGFFKQIPENKITAYILITLSWLPAFYAGHFIFKLCKPYKRSLQLFSKTADSSNVPLIAVLLFSVLVIFVLLGRGSLFGGYATYDANVRGKFSTLLVIYDFFLVYQLITKQKISILLIAGCILTSFFLLTMGGRMYVFQTLVILLVFKTSFARKKWNLKQINFILVTGLFAGSALGVWRQNMSFNFSKASYSFFAEPVFTWFSTSTFLINNKISLINFPLNFLTSFFNLVPNTFFSLRQYVVSTQDMGFITQSPLGADSVWSTLIINFGSIGSFLFILVTGFMLNLLRHNSENSRFGAVYYIMVCGLLPFQFFRDGFYIINKQLFFNFLLLPGFILLVLRFLRYAPSEKSIHKPDAVSIAAPD
jgi:hypothetical protein